MPPESSGYAIVSLYSIYLDKLDDLRLQRSINVSMSLTITTSLSSWFPSTCVPLDSRHQTGLNPYEFVLNFICCSISWFSVIGQSFLVMLKSQSSNNSSSTPLSPLVITSIATNRSSRILASHSATISAAACLLLRSERIASSALSRKKRGGASSV